MCQVTPETFENSAVAEGLKEDTTVVIPCFADMATEDIFWLFFTKTSELQKENGISGRWLERASSEPNTYVAWSKQDEEIEKCNTILKNGDFIRLQPNKDYVLNSNQCFFFNNNSVKEVDLFIRSSFHLD